VSDSLIDLAGLEVDAQDFLAVVLGSVTQPIWVVDADGLIRFANPAAIRTLGYGAADELVGRHSHATIHHSRPDGTPYPAEECPMLLPRATGETVVRDLDWFFRRDGSMFPVSYVSAPMDVGARRGAVVAFTDIGERLSADRAVHERDELLATQEESLLRIAAVVAGGAASAEVFAAVAREVSQVIGLPMVALWRYDADGTATVIGEWSERPHPFAVGSSWPLEGPTITGMVRASGRPCRLDGFADLPGAIADAARATGIGAAVGAPIIVDGRIWGAMSADAYDSEPLAAGIEDQLAEFTALVGTAISTALSREALVDLAGEQAALRRVATLVARQSSPEEVHRVVAEEVRMQLGTDGVGIMRFDPGGLATLVAQSQTPWEPIPEGTRFSLEGDNHVTSVFRTGQTARLDDWSDAWGDPATMARTLGIRSSVATPIVVEGRLWGTIVAVSRQPDPLPADTESRMGQFTELVATAISNAQARAELGASRARRAAAADDERRRVVRDLHDGAQQRLVHTVVTMQLATGALDRGEDPRPLLEEALAQAREANVELRELAHGILPSVLARGGLPAAVQTLASRTPVPIDADLSVGRLPAALEATAYFVVAEALTNVAKHAHAERAQVSARIEAGGLRVEIRDDGVGGARPDGTGFVGLGDRIAALDGRLRIESPRGGGTLVAAYIPLPG
jgi:PAS domain S-box-containing protein